MKNLTTILVLGMILSLVACKKETTSSGSAGVSRPAEEIKSGVVDGKINGDAWTFVSGVAKKDSFRPERIRLELWDNSEADPCNVFFPTSKRNLLTSVPEAVGNYELGNETNVTFYYQSTDMGSANLIATAGRLIIDEITDDTVKGRILATYDNDNTVNGAFTLTLCK